MNSRVIHFQEIDENTGTLSCIVWYCFIVFRHLFSLRIQCISLYFGYETPDMCIEILLLIDTDIEMVTT